MQLLPMILVATPVVVGLAACCRDLVKAGSASEKLQPVRDKDNFPSATMEPLGYIEPDAALKSLAEVVSEGGQRAEVALGSAIEQMGHFLHH